MKIKLKRILCFFGFHAHEEIKQIAASQYFPRQVLGVCPRCDRILWLRTIGFTLPDYEYDNEFDFEEW